MSNTTTNTNKGTEKLMLHPHRWSSLGFNMDDPVKQTIVCEVYGPRDESLDRAIRIKNSWNEYDSLREINRELLEALKEELSNREGTWDADEPKSSTYDAIQKLKALIKKATE